ncbi:YIF1-domain-containing protein [Infundibulicybe gibba]|nr:YIF1-domain-containing protein [Infundibulicybe gibba]
MSFSSSHSPPPLRHPVPTHPAYIPEPPSTPVSPQGYQRFSSSPGPPPQQPQHLHAQAYPAHVPAYTSPFQHQAPPAQQHQQQQIHHPQPQAQQPDFAAWGMNDATAQFGMQLGHSAVAAGQDYVQRNFGGIFPATTVKHHFNVSNSYVINKLRIVLFPWTHKPWARRVRRSEQGQSEWQPPREDINSPDLYIPVMALVTYIILAALHAGLKKDFDPKVLGDSASRAFIVVLFDFAFVQLGCYFLNVQGSSQVVDLFAYGGYKFVGVILALTVSLFELTQPLWKVVFIYAFLANAFFLLRSLRAVVLPDAAASTTPTTTVNPAQRRRRISFLFIEAVAQAFYMGFLCRV